MGKMADQLGPLDAPLWIGPTLRKLRVLLDLPAEDLARAAGINATQLVHIEKGRRPVTAARALRILRVFQAAHLGRSSGR